MSTFNGIVSEFPEIRIDYFRKNADAPPPLACFLSHVHSDHLAGLESLRSPFVYCSAATKEILLRLERYPCRINYAKGILEARQQTYKHLAKVLKPLPLETPTIIELRPSCQIQVTLFDANHCPGAVMFLVEGESKSILYTGDIRSEPWFVNSIARSPILVEYTSGIKTLDKIYLDTSFIKNVPFQTKAQGIAELIKKRHRVSHPSLDWTYGYEDVWVALSKALKSPIHVDDYKLRIYGSLKARSSEARFSGDYHLTPESPALTGYMCGNASHPGCLTADESVRLHSCEKGNMCEVARRSSTVIIQPIIAHLPSGENLAEVGVGGGGEDLQREAELDYLDQSNVDALLSSSTGLSAGSRTKLKDVLTRANGIGRTVHFHQGISSLDSQNSLNSMANRILERLGHASEQHTVSSQQEQGSLPRLIQFPYSRHSSYQELCQLVDIFRPRDVWPCTVDMEEWMRDGTSIASLFGEFCSGEGFEYDFMMRKVAERHAPLDMAGEHNSKPTSDSLQISTSTPKSLNHVNLINPISPARIAGQSGSRGGSRPANALEVISSPPTPRRKRSFDSFSNTNENNEQEVKPYEIEPNSSFCSTISERHSTTRREAYFQMLDNLDSEDWNPITLISTSNEHTTEEQEL